MCISIVVQAGGESRRMGHDKALVPFLGQPLIRRVIDRVACLGDELLITANRPEEFSFLGLPVFPDIYTERGALNGLYTALHAASHPVVVVVGCDMPFVSVPLLKALRDSLHDGEIDGAVPQSRAGYEPLHAVYRRETCLSAIRAALGSGQKRMISWFPAVRLVYFSPEQVAGYDPMGVAFINVNTPAELAATEALARRVEA